MRTVHGLVLTALITSTSALAGHAARAQDRPPSDAPAEAVREVEIVVERGYHPSEIPAVEGERLRLRFVRREWDGCTKEVVFPSLGIRRELPPDKPVVIELPPLTAGKLEFECGMKMRRGAVLVAARG